MAGGLQDEDRNDVAGAMIPVFAFGVAALVVMAAIGEQLGAPPASMMWVLAGGTLFAGALLAFETRTSDGRGIFLAHRAMPAWANGLAGMASTVAFAGMTIWTSAVYRNGYDAFAPLLGFAAGIVVSQIVVAPALNRWQAATLADFLGRRYGAPTRGLAALILAAVAFALLVVHVMLGSELISQALSQPRVWVLAASTVMLVAIVVPGGLTSATWTSAGFGVFVLAVLLAPLTVISFKAFGMPVPYIGYGQALPAIASLEEAIVEKGLVDFSTFKPYLKPFLAIDRWNFCLVALTALCATLLLPQVVSQTQSSASASSARRSLAWTLFFAAFLMAALPAYATLSRLQVSELLAGETHRDKLPLWAQRSIEAGTLRIAPAADAPPLAASNSPLTQADIKFDGNTIVLSAPAVAGMPAVLSAAMLAGLMAAYLAGAAMLLTTIAGVVSHDLVPSGPASDPLGPRRVIVFRVTAILVAIAAAAVALIMSIEIVELATAAITVMVCGLLPMLIAGLWWPRANQWGAMAASLTAIALAIYYGFGTSLFAVSFVDAWGHLSVSDPEVLAAFTELKAGWLAAEGDARAIAYADVHQQAAGSLAAPGLANWFGVSRAATAVIAVPIGVLVLAVVSLLTGSPSDKVRSAVSRAHRTGPDSALTGDD